MKYTSLFPLLICFLCLGSIGTLHSQSVIAADGGESGTAKIRIEWTLGEFAVSTLSSPAGWLTEGFHQPHLQVVRMPSPSLQSISPLEQDLSIHIAPNPVQDILNIKLQRKQDLSLHLRMLDTNGRLLLQQKVMAPDQLEVNLAKYPSGLYFLQFHDPDGNALEVFKIRKH